MILRLTALALLLAIVFAACVQSVNPPSAAEPIRMPFPGGSSVKILQGYQGGPPQGVERYSLDLVVTNLRTSGAPVVSPVNGRVDWA